MGGESGRKEGGREGERGREGEGGREEGREGERNTNAEYYIEC